ncbi:MAG: hypothetical protein II796_00025 [Oscillospiraceae bacterium]|nr:hypothetical protein [Oscillospiraceae bacterium]
MGKVISFSMESGTVVEGSSVLALEAAPQMIIESELEASQALGILKTTLIQAGKVAGS